MERGGIIEVEAMSMPLPLEVMEPHVELPSLLEVHRQTELEMGGRTMTAGALFDMCPHANNPDIMTPEAVNRYMAKLLHKNGIEVGKEYQHCLEPSTEVTRTEVAQKEQTKLIVDSKAEPVATPTRAEKVVTRDRVATEEIEQVVKMVEVPEAPSQEVAVLPLPQGPETPTIVLPEIADRIILPEAPDKVPTTEVVVVSQPKAAIIAVSEVLAAPTAAETLRAVNIPEARQEEVARTILLDEEVSVPAEPLEQANPEVIPQQPMVEVAEARAVSHEVVAEVVLPMPQEDEKYYETPFTVSAPFEIPTYAEPMDAHITAMEPADDLPTQELIDAVEEALQPVTTSEKLHEPEAPTTEALIQEQYAWTVEIATSEPETVFASFTDALADFAKATAPSEVRYDNEFNTIDAIEGDPITKEETPHAVAAELAEVLQVLEPEQVEVVAPTVQAIARTVQEIGLMRLYEDRDMAPDITAAEERLVELVTELCEQLHIEDTEKVQQLVAILLAKDFMAPPQKEVWLDLEHMGTHEVKRDFAPLISGADAHEKGLSIHAVLGYLCTTPSLRSAFN